jgi:hypothetical protein
MLKTKKTKTSSILFTNNKTHTVTSQKENQRFSCSNKVEDSTKSKNGALKILRYHPKSLFSIYIC